MCVGKSFGVFFPAIREVVDGFHAPIFVIRAVLKCDLSSFVRVFSLENSVFAGRGMLHA